MNRETPSFIPKVVIKVSMKLVSLNISSRGQWKVNNKILFVGHSSELGSWYSTSLSCVLYLALDPVLRGLPLNIPKNICKLNNVLSTTTCRMHISTLVTKLSWLIPSSNRSNSGCSLRKKSNLLSEHHGFYFIFWSKPNNPYIVYHHKNYQ